MRRTRTKHTRTTHSRPNSTARPVSPLVTALTGGALAGLAGLTYAAGYERSNFAVRRHTLPLLSPGSDALRVLHLSDLHMMPGQRRKQDFVSALRDLDPDLVVNTGDNLSSADAVPSVVQSLGSLLDVPGAFVFGSNDYFAPVPKNPLPYIGIGTRTHSQIPLPWQDLRAAFGERGWFDATQRRGEVTLRDGRRVQVAGVDDPHLGLDRYEEVAGPAGAGFDLRLGLTHSPEPRVLDRFDSDGFDLALAGHTHGGQLRLPTGAIVTNCGIDRTRARGLSAWGRRLVLHVSPGLGTSPFVPVRTFCRPEATLLTLVGAPGGGGGDDDAVVPADPRSLVEPVPA